MPVVRGGPLPPDHPLFKGPTTVFFPARKRPSTDGKKKNSQEQSPPPGRKDQEEE